MDASDWTDNVVLERTMLLQEGVLSRLSIDLGDGKPFTSEAADPAELRKHMIAWCEAVRDTVRNRDSERKLKARRDAELSVPVHKSPETASVSTLQSPQSAVAHAKEQLEIAVDMLGQFCQQKAKLEKRIEEVKVNIDGWGRVVLAFGKAEPDEPTDD